MIVNCKNSSNILAWSRRSSTNDFNVVMLVMLSNTLSGLDYMS